MTLSNNCLNFIRHWEGLVLHPYLDSVGVPTIGIGTTFYENGTRVRMSDLSITEERAMELLKHHLETIGDTLSKLVIVSLNQNQIDSLMSFIYNLGIGALQQSTLLKKLNVNPNDPTIRGEFEKWVYASGKVLPGLQLRRQAEADLYFTK